RDLDRRAREGKVHDAEGRDRADVGQFDYFFRRDSVARTRTTAATDVDLAALRTPLAEDLPAGQPAQEARPARARRKVILEPDRHRDDHPFVAHASTSKHSMSWILPSRSARQRARTRKPVFMVSSEPAATACNIAVSAPSSLISAHANGFCRGLFLRGSFTHAHDVTTPD